MKLTKMANQIATFFASQRGDQPAAIAAHLNENWAPKMRADFLAQDDEADQHPLLVQAKPLIRS
ncbi:formate dehydrogenase subunit delta [Albirhodobacter sp. R86504]|jgi:formate dehydrogenase subunit delta|uniref:formate dehydrogenase subunit delta n=1 Tax=Albirhodobacter sp. R86504 TaxID=3093848 RepID=UPI00366D1C42